MAALYEDQKTPLPGLSDILTSIVVELHRFFVMPDEDAKVIAPWIIHTHVFSHLVPDTNGMLRSIFDHTPRLIAWSKEHGSGKSTLADLMGRLVPSTLSISSLSGSELKGIMRHQAQGRLAGQAGLTFLLDEAEQYAYTGLLSRLMNGGHRHDGYTWDAKHGRISLFAPMAVFRRFDPRHEPQLKPVVSRSLLLEMKRRDPDNSEHQREEFRARNPYVEQLGVLKERTAAVVERLIPEFAAWRPENGFLKGNRNADNWEPLAAIADLAGEHWPKLVRERAQATAREQDKERQDEAIRVRVGGHTQRGPRSISEEIDRSKTLIKDHLARVGRRTSRSELHKAVFSNNIKASILEAAIEQLQAEGWIKTMNTSLGPGRPAQTIVLVEVGPSETAVDSAQSATDVTADSGLEERPPQRPDETTDRKIMGALHEVLGSCALDPSSPPEPVHVQALRWYALALGQDGLQLSWHIPNDGHAWLYGNFPWGRGRGERSQLLDWATKLSSEVQSGNVPRAVTLWPYSPDTRWYKFLKTIPGVREVQITRKGLKFGDAKNGPSTNLRVFAFLIVGLRPEELAALRAALSRHGVDVVPD
jgi:hypothetical protein